MLQGKTIVLGVCGGIAAYKAAALCSKLAQAGADVRVIMTESATKFVAPLTFQTLSRHDVIVDTFDEKDASVVSHIDLADRADLVVVAPATANMLAKMAHGIADDMLSTTLLATQAPVLAAPAMNVHMIDHPAVKENMAKLEERGVRFVEPGFGQLACGYVGKGRLAEPDELFAAIAAALREAEQPKPLAGWRVLVTAGGTVERIDPVRYMTNDSSGKMGVAVAEAARDAGARVTLVYGKLAVPLPSGVDAVRAESALEMLDAVMARLPETDIVIKAAAVADYRAETIAPQKIKKQADTLTLKLVKNPDILQTVGENKGNRFVVGFAAETEQLEQHALDKLRRKHCDLIVANDVSQEGAGFRGDTNIVSVYDEAGLVEAMPLLGKKEAARRLIAMIALRFAERRA